MHSRVYFRSALCALVFVSLLAAPTAAQQSEEQSREAIEVTVPGEYRPEDSPKLDTAVRQIIRRTNQFREKKGLAPVEAAESLTKAAEYFAGFMAKNDLYGHTADDQRPADRAREHGYEMCIVAENIAYRFETLGFTTKELAREFVKGWRESPEHRKNMLDPDVTETGVAVARSDKTGVFYAVQMFGRPRSASVEFAVRNESPLAVEYQLGKRSFELPPRYSRRHEMCRTAELNFKPTDDVEPVAEVADETYSPASGTTYLVEADGEKTYRVVRQDGDSSAN